MNSVRNCPLCFVLFTQYPMFTEDIIFCSVLLSVPKCQPNEIEGKIIIMHTAEHIHTAGVELPLGFIALRWCAAG